MDAKLEAKELVEKYCQILFGDTRYVNLTQPKKCAILCVEQTQKELSGVWSDIVSRINKSCEDTLAHQLHLQKVKEEITTL